MKKALFVCYVFTTLSGCRFSTISVSKNGEIDIAKRTEIDSMNRLLVKAINEDDTPTIRAMMAPEIIRGLGKELSQFAQLFEDVKLSGYRVLDEYAVVSTPKVISTLVREDSLDDGYVFRYVPMHSPSYVSLLVAASGLNEVLLTVIYCKEKQDWKIFTLNAGQYAISGKKMSDYFRQSKECYQNSALVDAIVYLNAAEFCMKPSQMNLQFSAEDDVRKFEQNLLEKTNTYYRFPVALPGIATKPQIFSVFARLLGDQFCPVIDYLSSINLRDSVSLKSEYEKVELASGKLFNGLNHGRSFVIYRAFNKIPQKGESVPIYQFIDSLDRSGSKTIKL